MNEIIECMRWIVEHHDALAARLIVPSVDVKAERAKLAQFDADAVRAMKRLREDGDALAQFRARFPEYTKPAITGTPAERAQARVARLRLAALEVDGAVPDDDLGRADVARVDLVVDLLAPVIESLADRCKAALPENRAPTAREIERAWQGAVAAPIADAVEPEWREAAEWLSRALPVTTYAAAEKALRAALASPATREALRPRGVKWSRAWSHVATVAVSRVLGLGTSGATIKRSAKAARRGTSGATRRAAK